MACTKAVSKMRTSNHCILHRQALAVKRMPKSFKSVLDDAVQIVYFIIARPSNSRLFKLLCNEMSSEFETLTFCTKVCWLSHDKVLMRVFQLRKETAFFV
jgi:hypothetical protein